MNGPHELISSGLVMRRLLGVIVKYGISWLGVLLVTHSAVTEEQAHNLTSIENVEMVVGALMTMAPVVWSMFAKVTNQKELSAALHLRPGASMEDIKIRAQAPDIQASDVKPA